MTKDEALRLAWDSLEDIGDEWGFTSQRTVPKRKEAITAIKAALEAKDEPVAWGVFEGNLHDMFFSQEEAQEMADLKGTHAEVRPLYATPQRTWVGLTDDEIEHAFKTNSVMVDNGNAYMVAGLRAVNIAQAIEAKLRSKNT